MAVAMGSNEKLVWNALLNYAFRAIKAGNRSEDIAKKAVEFFSEEAIAMAKELLWPLAGITTRVTARSKNTDDILDILKVFRVCEDKNISLPRFVIFEPDEVPIIPGEVTATLTRKVNELCAKFDSYVDSNPSPSVSAMPAAETNTIMSKLSYAVVLKNPPKDLSNPSARKSYLHRVCGDISSNIVELKPTKSEWRVVLNNKNAAESLAEAVGKSDSTISVKVKTPAFFGIIRHVPTETSDDELRSVVPNCVKAVQIGSTRSFKLQFESKAHLFNAMNSPPIFGYERLPITEFKFLPMQCYNCQSYGHAAKSCVDPPKCSKCGGDHSSSRDNPCQNAPKCALCGSSRHPCYSFQCPVAQKLISKQ